MTAAPGGDLCPICRILLFRPPLKVLLLALPTDLLWFIKYQLWEVSFFWLRFSGWLPLSCWALAVVMEPSFCVLQLFLQDNSSRCIGRGVMYDINYS
jgi:hypothetical protein